MELTRGVFVGYRQYWCEIYARFILCSSNFRTPGNLVPEPSLPWYNVPFTLRRAALAFTSFKKKVPYHGILSTGSRQAGYTQVRGTHA